MVKKLKPGDQAPELKGNPVNTGGKFDLKEKFSNKPVLVVFSRYFGCPVCQSDFDKLLEIKDKVKQKAELVYITQSSEDSIQEFIKDREGVEFPILSDPEKPFPMYESWKIGNITMITIAKMAKVVIGSKYKHGEYEGHEKQSPADFLVGTDGNLLHVNYSLFNSKKILKILDSL